LKIKIYFPSIVLVGAMSFFAYDIVLDLMTTLDSYIHILLEFLVFVAISVVLFRELKQVTRLSREIRAEKLKSARLAGELLEVMHAQFQHWGLSSTEVEVALLLIKGLSMQEIADLRQVKEKTVRQQATGIYAKSGNSGRHELVAYLIEDLMSQV
jgi:DNA-binding CsgD family transcriptional regulator